MKITVFCCFSMILVMLIFVESRHKLTIEDCRRIKKMTPFQYYNEYIKKEYPETEKWNDEQKEWHGQQGKDWDLSLCASIEKQEKINQEKEKQLWLKILIPVVVALFIITVFVTLIIKKFIREI